MPRIVNTDYTRTADSLTVGDVVNDYETYCRIRVERVSIIRGIVLVTGTLLEGRDETPAGRVNRRFRTTNRVTVTTRTPDATPSPLCASCFTDRHGWEPDMGDPVTWEPGTCSACGNDRIVFTEVEA